MNIALILVLPVLFLAMSVCACRAQYFGPVTPRINATAQMVDAEVMEDRSLGFRFEDQGGAEYWEFSQTTIRMYRKDPATTLTNGLWTQFTRCSFYSGGDNENRIRS